MQYKIYMRIVLILILLIVLGNSDLVNYGSIQNTIPSYTYPITLRVGDTLVATLSWTNTQDLDIYIYKQGQDLLSRSVYLAR